MTTTTTGVEIRPFAQADYAEITRIHNANFAPEFALEDDDFQFYDDTRPEHCQAARWIAECDSSVVGFANYDQNSDTFHPRKFQLEVAIDNAYYSRGIGRRLYDVVLHDVQQFDPLELGTWSREDMAWRVGFLERRGFVADMRLWTSALDLTTLDLSRFADKIPAAEAQGIRLTTFADLGSEDAEVRGKIYEMWLEMRYDVPIPPSEVRTEVSFERFWEEHLRPSLLPAGYFIALDGEDFVGVSQLWLSREADALRTGLTGVTRSHRRRGIAFALKVRALQFAVARGYKRVYTENESNNRGMLAINDELGFVRFPAWNHYIKSFA